MGSISRQHFAITEILRGDTITPILVAFLKMGSVFWLYSETTLFWRLETVYAEEAWKLTAARLRKYPLKPLKASLSRPVFEDP